MVVLAGWLLCKVGGSGVLGFGVLWVVCLLRALVLLGVVGFVYFLLRF